jgi:hypothetical protein
MSKVTQARNELKARLVGVDGIDAALNPVDARDKTKHPESGAFAVVWTLDGKQEVGQKSVIWRRPFGVDIAVPWNAAADMEAADMEAYLDTMCKNIVLSLAAKWDAQLTHDVTIESLSIAYPDKGNGKAVISFEITLRIVDSQP